jgi:hypothetical protein
MKIINKGLETVLRSAITESLKKYELSNEDSFLGDLYLYYDGENQALTFFDDVENELLAVNLSDQDIIPDAELWREIKTTAKHILKELEKEKVFDKEFICKPFSVSLIDSDFIVIEELIFIDDDTLKIDKNLWSGLNKELDDFLKQLMQ